MGRARQLVAAASLVLLVVFLALWWRQSTALDDEVGAPVFSPSATPADSDTPGGTATSTGSAGSTAPPSTASQPPSASQTAPSPTTGSTPLPAGCSAASTPIEPARFAIPRLGVDSSVLHVGLQGGDIGVPPKNDPVSVGWWTGSPKPGATKGHTVMTTHTYHAGGALGNKLYSAQGLRVGDLVRVSDAAGRTGCYRYTGAEKVWVKSYDPNSTVVVDDAGAPKIVLVICWDWVARTKFWDSRIVFSFEPVA